MPDEFELAAQRAREQVDGWLRQSQEQAEKAQRVSREVEAIRETETASDRTVTVAVDAGGRLVDLKLTREAMDLYPADLATTILECVDKARSRSRIWLNGCDRPTARGRMARRTRRTQRTPATGVRMVPASGRTA